MSNKIFEIGNITIINADFMSCIDEYGPFDSIITDPPYGLRNKSGRRMHAYKDKNKHKGKIGGNNFSKSKEYHSTDWDEAGLSSIQWNKIQKISNNQIVWGWDYLIDILGNAPRSLVWDKKEKNGWEDYFSDFEMGWCSIPGPARMYRHRFMGGIQKEKENRIHPTQKPLKLMEWCLHLCKQPEYVCDPFLGSGTTALACLNSNTKFVGMEIDPKYFRLACDRLLESYNENTDSVLPLGEN